MRKVEKTVLIILLGLFVLDAQGAEINSYFGKTSPRKEQKIIIANASEPATLDPALVDDVVSVQIVINIYEGLFGYDPKTVEPVPRIARSWEVLDNGRVYIFHLRNDARWSNGEPVTAHDFVWAWKRALNPQLAASMANLMYHIKNAKAYNQMKVKICDRDDETRCVRDNASSLVSFVNGEGICFFSKDDALKYLEANKTKIAEDDFKKLEVYSVSEEDIGIRTLDNFTLRVELEKPSFVFIKLLPLTIYSPLYRKIIEAYETKDQNYFRPSIIVKNFIGNGPFILAEWKMSDKILLKKNPYYWDFKNIRLEEAEYAPIENSTAVINLYKTGYVDVTTQGQIPVYFLPVLKSKKDFYEAPSLGSLYLSFNTQKPYGANALFKKSIHIGINKEEICKSLNNQPAMALVPPGFTHYRDMNTVYFDPEKARELFTQSGVDKTIRLNLMAPHNDRNKVLLEAVQGELRQRLGLANVEVSFQEFQVFIDSLKLKDFDGARTGWVADYVDPLAFLEVLLSYNSNNYTGWINKNYDRLVEAASFEMNEDKRLRMLEEAEAILLAELPIIPLCYSTNTILIKPYVQGWYNNALDVHPLNEVSINTEWALESKEK